TGRFYLGGVVEEVSAPILLRLLVGEVVHSTAQETKKFVETVAVRPEWLGIFEMPLADAGGAKAVCFKLQWHRGSRNGQPQLTAFLKQNAVMIAPHTVQADSA